MVRSDMATILPTARWPIERPIPGGTVQAVDLTVMPPVSPMLAKVKHQRTADVAIAGYRRQRSGDGIGSLLLGLYDDGDTLHHVGVATSFTAARRAELVAEVAYEHLQGHRFRHATRLVRFRPDREPASCTYDQLEQVVPYELHRIFAL